MTSKLNIRSDSPDWRGAILSNLAYTPFRIGRVQFKCVEGALQGIKLSPPHMQKNIFAMSGLNALRAGRRAVRRPFQNSVQSYVYWQGEVIEYNSLEHRLLIAMFIGEKVRQNPRVQQALLETEGTFIFHDVGGVENPHTSLPEKFYIEVLLTQRRLLKKLHKIRTV